MLSNDSRTVVLRVLLHALWTCSILASTQGDYNTSSATYSSESSTNANAIETKDGKRVPYDVIYAVCGVTAGGVLVLSVICSRYLYTGNCRRRDADSNDDTAAICELDEMTSERSQEGPVRDAHTERRPWGRRDGSVGGRGQALVYISTTEVSPGVQTRKYPL